MVEKQLDRVLKRNTLNHLGLTDDVPGFNVSIAAFSCIYLIQQREKEISESEDKSFLRYTSETLLDELVDMGVPIDDNYYGIIRKIQDEQYISIDNEDNYYSGKLSMVLVNILSIVYPTMEGLLLVAYFVQTAEEVKSFRKTLEAAIAQVDQTLKSQGVSVDMEKIPREYNLILNKIIFHPNQFVDNGGGDLSSFAAVCKDRILKREKVISTIRANMKKKGELPVLPLNGNYIKQMMSQPLYATSDVADIILSDVAMTINILKKVNENKKGRSVSTVSHAIMLLGNDELHKTINNFTSLDDVDDGELRKELEHIFASSYMSNSIARNYAAKAEIKDFEEVCICSMIHNLGQMIVLYYYPEAYYEIKKKTLKHNNKRKSARDVLGTTYDNIGIHFATDWNLPFTTIESLKVCYFNRIGKTRDNLIVNLPFCSAELCAFLGGGLDRKQTIRLRELINSLNMFSRELVQLLEKSWADVTVFSKKQKIEITKREIAKIASTG